MAWETSDTYCFGCTPSHQIGLRLEPAIAGGRAVAAWQPTHQHEGPPGVTHGGLVMCALDEVMTILACRSSDAVYVTGTLTVRLAAPLPVDVEHRIEAAIERTEGRKLFISGRVVAARGTVAAEAEGVWIRSATAPPP